MDHLVPDLSLLDPSLAPWLDGAVREHEGFLGPEVHSLVCPRTAPRATLVTRRASLQSRERQVYPCSQCSPSGEHPHLLEVLAGLCAAAVRDQPAGPSPYQLETYLRHLHAAKAKSRREDLGDRLDVVLEDLDVRFEEAQASLRDWAASPAALEALDLMASLVADRSKPHWLVEALGLSRLGGEVEPPRGLDDPRIRSTTALTKGWHASDLEGLAQAHLRELEATADRHRLRERKPGRLLVHSSVQRLGTTSGYLDFALTHQWSPAPGILVLPRSAAPLVRHWGQEARSAVLKDSDSAAVIEVAATLVLESGTSPAQALKAARAIES